MLFHDIEFKRVSEMAAIILLHSLKTQFKNMSCGHLFFQPLSVVFENLN